VEEYMKKILRLIILIFFIVFLFKCTGGGVPLRRSVEVEEEKLKGKEVVAFVGIEEKIGSPKALNKFFIRSWIVKESGGLLHQIYAEYGYVGKEWEFYTKAYNQEGGALQTVKIHRDVEKYESINVYHEEIGITIPDEYLRSHLNGFKIKVIALSGDSFVINVTPEQIQSQLNKIQEYKRLNKL
jgi:hypothetical protein